MIHQQEKKGEKGTTMCVCVCVCVCVCLCVYVHMYVCGCMCMHVCVYTVIYSLVWVVHVLAVAVVGVLLLRAVEVVPQRLAVPAADSWVTKADQ